MKLLVLATGMTSDYNEPEDSCFETTNLGVAYGWTTVRELIKQDLRNEFNDYWPEGKDEYICDGEDVYGYGDSENKLKEAIREINKKDFFTSHISVEDMEQITNGKYIYPMVPIAEFDILSNDSGSCTTKYYVVRL